LVVSRNDLHVHNETEILTALLRWSVFECHRRKLDITVDNQRLVLDQFIWHVRYLAMPVQEVQNAPIISQLLSPKESSALFAYQMGHQDADQLPDVIRRNLQRISTGRKYISSTTPDTDFSVNSTAPSCRKSCVTEKIFVCLACIFEWAHYSVVVVSKFVLSLLIRDLTSNQKLNFMAPERTVITISSTVSSVASFMILIYWPDISDGKISHAR